MTWFFKINMQQGMSMQTIWDASKAYLRGIAISRTAKIRQKEHKKMEGLVKKIKKRELDSQENPTNLRIQQRIRKIHHKIKIIQTEELEKKLKITKQTFFENANKIGRQLSYNLKKQKQKIMSSEDEK